VFKKIR